MALDFQIPNAGVGFSVKWTGRPLRGGVHYEIFTELNWNEEGSSFTVKDAREDEPTMKLMTKGGALGEPFGLQNWVSPNRIISEGVMHKSDSSLANSTLLSLSNVLYKCSTIIY